MRTELECLQLLAEYGVEYILLVKTKQQLKYFFFDEDYDDVSLDFLNGVPGVVERIYYGGISSRFKIIENINYLIKKAMQKEEELK